MSDEASEMSEGGCYVYFIQMGIGIKIGISNDPEKRLYQLSSGYELPKLIFTYKHENKEEALLTESYLHKLLLPFNIRGEWFKLTPEQIFSIHSFVKTFIPIKWALEHDVEFLKRKMYAEMLLPKPCETDIRLK